MKIELKWVLMVVGIALLACGGMGWYIYNLKPEVQVVEKEVIKYQQVEKIVIKYRQNKKVDTETHKEKVTETRPDGTTIVTEREDTKTKEDTQTDINTDQNTQTQVEQQIVTKTVNVQKDWHLSAKIGLNVKEFPSWQNLTPIYGVDISRRIIGPFSVGVWGLTSGQAGASLTLEW